MIVKPKFCKKKKVSYTRNPKWEQNGWNINIPYFPSHHHTFQPGSFNQISKSRSKLNTILANPINLKEMAPLVWLVTGCSTGIGLELVHSILARGDRVIATARSLSKIEYLKEAGAHVLRLDVTEEQVKIDDVAKEAIAVYGGVDVLVVR